MKMRLHVHDSHRDGRTDKIRTQSRETERVSTGLTEKV